MTARACFGAAALALALALAVGPAAASNTSAAETPRGKTIAVIGAGFSGLTAACELQKLGYEVILMDKNPEVGGRAQTFTTPDGFTFDMGPSWYVSLPAPAPAPGCLPCQLLQTLPPTPSRRRRPAC